MDAEEIIGLIFGLTVCPLTFKWWLQLEAEKGRKAKARAKAREEQGQ